MYAWTIRDPKTWYLLQWQNKAHSDVNQPYTILTMHGTPANNRQSSRVNQLNAGLVTCATAPPAGVPRFCIQPREEDNNRPHRDRLRQQGWPGSQAPLDGLSQRPLNGDSHTTRQLSCKRNSFPRRHTGTWLPNGFFFRQRSVLLLLD